MHSCKSWSICCVRQLLALYSPPGRSMLTPVPISHKMKWCGGMTFGHTGDYATDRDAPHATGPCGPAFARAFLIFESFRALWGSRRSLLWLPTGGGGVYSLYQFYLFGLQWKRSEAPSRRRWIGKVPFFANGCMNGMNIAL